MAESSTEIRQRVREFYDQIGWQQLDDGQFDDAIRFEDLRPVSREYLHRCHLRLGRYLPASGKYLLDAASGPIQYPEYLEYSRGFNFRICVDISLRALRQARQRIGAAGLCVQADVTSLPFPNDSLDGIVSLHTIYHVPKDLQERAVREIYRVLKPGTTAAIVYSWGEHSSLMKLLVNPLLYLRYLPGRIARFPFRWMRKRRRPVVVESGPQLYGFRFDYEWFASRNWGFPLEVKVWRSVSVPFLRLYVHRLLLGGYLLRWVYRMEERFPRFLGRHGYYPVLVIQKIKPADRID